MCGAVRMSGVLPLTTINSMTTRRKLRYLCPTCKQSEREYYRSQIDIQPCMHPPMVDTPDVVIPSMVDQLRLPMAIEEATVEEVGVVRAIQSPADTSTEGGGYYTKSEWFVFDTIQNRYVRLEET